MTRGGNVAIEVPDHLVGIGEPLGEEAAAVLRGEHTRVAPAHSGERTLVLLIARVDLKDVDDQQVARLGPLDVEGPREDVHAGKRGIPNVIGGVIVVDGAVEPLADIRAEYCAGLDRYGRRDVRVPPVVPDDLLVGELLGVIHQEEILRHRNTFLRADSCGRHTPVNLRR